MVKLFVGGLPDGVDSMRLRQLFSQFVVVNECDVIKDYAFVVRYLENLIAKDDLIRKKNLKQKKMRSLVSVSNLSCEQYLGI